MRDSLDLDSLEKWVKNYKTNAQLIQWFGFALNLGAFFFIFSFSGFIYSLLPIGFVPLVVMCFIVLLEVPKYMLVSYTALGMTNALKNEIGIDLGWRVWRNIAGELLTSVLIWTFIILVSMILKSILVFFVLLGIRWVVNWLILQWTIRQPLKKGKYKSALWRTRLLRRVMFWERNFNLGIEGYLHFLLGDFKQAEFTHRKIAEKGRRKGNVTMLYLAFNDLGYMYTLLGRYEEALPMLQNAIRLNRAAPNAYDSLALWYLSQDLDPQRALALAQTALEYSGGKNAIQTATLAWAVARLGMVDEARKLMDTARDLAKKTEIPHRAETWRLVGLGLQALGDESTARIMWEQAAKLDTAGIFGRLSRRLFTP